MAVSEPTTKNTVPGAADAATNETLVTKAGARRLRGKRHTPARLTSERFI
jgi:hypothetical protein